MEATINENLSEFLKYLEAPAEYDSIVLQSFMKTDARYLRDLKMNIKGVMKSDFLDAKETALLAYAASITLKNSFLQQYFSKLAKNEGATNDEIMESAACASLLSSNNVLYRFRHFTGKEKYKQLPARLRMNIMMNPVLGKEFFELISLVISAINGCEMCVNAHENSLVEMGSTEERIFDAIRIASVIASADKLVS
jgi:lipoyl-dependent peroxiredoxin subunit D